MKALILVDLQNDFMPGGPLGAPGGDEIIPIINQLLPKFSHVLATQDWHPKNHQSFASNHPGKKTGDVVIVKGIEQILWPDHCVQNSKGAELVSSLNKECIDKIFHKGTDEYIDSYSTFFDNARLKSTGMEEYLRSHHLDEIYIAGIATDYCVLYSVLDALDLGFKVFVIVDACRAINLSPDDESEALAAMNEKGAVLISSSAL